jgi:hypothetical protein
MNAPYWPAFSLASPSGENAVRFFSTFAWRLPPPTFSTGLTDMAWGIGMGCPCVKQMTPIYSPLSVLAAGAATHHGYARILWGRPRTACPSF